VLCVRTLSASVGQSARYGRRKALLGKHNAIRGEVSPDFHRAQTKEQNRRRVRGCFTGAYRVPNAYGDLLLLVLGSFVSVYGTTRHWGDQNRPAANTSHPFNAPPFPSPGALLRTCVNQLGWYPHQRTDAKLPPLALWSRSMAWMWPAVSGTKNKHNLVEQDLEFRYVHGCQHDGTRTSRTTASYQH